MLTELLTQSPAALATLVARAGRLGHELHRPRAVLVVRADSAPEPDPNRRIDAQRQVLSAVHAVASGQSPRPLAARHGDDVVVLWPLDVPAVDGSAQGSAPTPVTVTVAVSRPGVRPRRRPGAAGPR